MFAPFKHYLKISCYKRSISKYSLPGRENINRMKYYKAKIKRIAKHFMEHEICINWLIYISSTYI